MSTLLWDVKGWIYGVKSSLPEPDRPEPCSVCHMKK